MRYLALLLLPCLLAGCLNTPEKERAELRNDIDRAAGPDDAEMRERLRTMLIGSPESPPDTDPHMRAEAARGLGNLHNADDSGLLLDVLMGPLADENLAVRLECAIALGKLEFQGRTDLRRTNVLQNLRNRLAFDRDEAGRPFETQFLVRTAMLNSMISLGGRDAAIAVHDVAERVYADMQDVQASIYTSATDRGLLDRAFQGLAELTGVGEKAAAQNRFDTENLGRHLDWWAQRIAEMAEGP
jgi:hypothetical protein